MKRLQHDCAIMIAQHGGELLVNVLDGDQLRQAREGLYRIALAGLECYELQVERMQRRLRPLDN